MIRNIFRSVSAIALTAFSLTSDPLFAHSGETHAPRQYQPTTNEFGAYDPSLQPERTVDVTMRDSMTFEPASINVRAGEVVLFRVTNAGTLMHEFVLGTNDSLEQHAVLMKKFPGMEHDEPYMAHVPPGESMGIVWKFDKAGEFGFACLLPGHYDAGMSGELTVK